MSWLYWILEMLGDNIVWGSDAESDNVVWGS